MLFNWWARRRRNRIRRQPFADAWWEIIERNVAYVQRLTADEQEKLRLDTRVFVEEKNWEGCNGLEMNDEVRVTIAAHMSLLCLGFTDQYFDTVESILVYPDAYVAHGQTSLGGGFVLEGESNREGEAWYRGPVILSWGDIVEDGRRDQDGNNLVLHEFAHQLDMQGGRAVTGTPPLPSQEDYARWQQIMEDNYQRLAADCQAGRRTVMDCYGATNLAEFFAVATECFFEAPRPFRVQHEDLYQLLKDYYRQDPIARFPDSGWSRLGSLGRVWRRPTSGDLG